MPSKTQSFADGSQAAFHHACPKCGSAEVRRLSLIYQAGLSMGSAGNGAGRTESTLSKHAAPPVKKNVVSWSLLAGAALVVALASFANRGVGTIIAGVVAVTAATLAVRASRYNSAVYPGLQDLWARSFMCGRCGEVFSE